MIIIIIIIAITITIRIIVRVIIEDSVINKGPNDFVFHYVLFLEISNLLFRKSTVDKVVLTNFRWVFKLLNRFLYRVKLF